MSAEAQSSLVSLLSKLSSSDGKLIKDATAEFNAFVKRPESVEQLFGVLSSVGIDSSIRSAAGVMLRKKMKTFASWSESDQRMAQSTLLGLMSSPQQQQEKTLLRNLIELAARAFAGGYVVGGSEGGVDPNVPRTTYWTELVDLVGHGARSASSDDRVFAFLLLNSMLAAVTDDVSPLLPFLVEVLALGLQDPQSARVRYEAMKAMATLVTDSECWPGSNDLGEDAAAAFRNRYQFQMAELAKLTEFVCPAIRSLLVANTTTDSAVDFDTDLFDVFSCVLSHAVLLNQVDLRASIELATEVICSGDRVDEFVRKGAFQYIIDCARAKPTLIAKIPGGIEGIVRQIFALMCVREENERDMDSLLQSSAQCIDTLAQRLPSSSIVPVLLSCIEPAVAADQPKFTKRAAYLALAVSVEGSCRYYTENCLQNLVRLIVGGINETEGVVSLSALFALGELLSYVESSACQFGPVFMPVLLEALDKVARIDYEKADDSTQLWIGRLFYAIEEACECLDNDLVDYLDDLFKRLFFVQRQNPSVRMQEFALESVSFAVSAVDKLIEPWVADLLAVLSQCLKTDGEPVPAFTEALSALSSVFRYANTPQIREHADAAALFAANLLDNSQTEAAERSGAYDVLAALTYVYKDKIDDDLVKRVVEHAAKTFTDEEDHELIQSLRNGTDSTAAANDDDDDAFGDQDMSEDDDDDDSDSDSDDDFELLERDLADERVSALGMISDLSMNAETKLIVYFDKIWPAVHRHLDHPEEDIQNNAVRCACCLLVMCYNVASKTVKNGQPAIPGAVSEQRIETNLKKIFEDLSEKIRENEVHNLVSAALNGLQILIGGFDKSFFSVIPVDRVSKLLELVLTRKVACLSNAHDADLDLEEPELDGLVMEAAGDVLPSCANALNQDEHTCLTFKKEFSNCVQLLLEHLKRPNSTRKAFVLATIACAMNNQSCMFIDQQLAFEIFSTFMNETQDEVVQNSVYGMRVLISKCPEYCAPHLEDLFVRLHGIVTKRAPLTNPKPSPLRDNVCGCASQILWAVAAKTTDPNSLKTIFDFVVSMLPLKGDQENYGPLFEALTTQALLQASFINQKQTEALVEACVNLIGGDDDEDLNPDGKMATVKYLAWHAEYKNDLVIEALNKCSAEQKAVIEKKMKQERK